MKKKFLIIAGIVILMMGLASFWGYNKYFAPDPEVEQQLTDQFGEDFFNSFDDEIVVNNPEAVKNDALGNEQKPDDPIIVPVPETTPSTPTPVNGDIVPAPITQEQISNKYKPQFTHLQSVALSRLETLYAAAIQEYTQGSKDGTLSRSKLAQKYIQAGTMLEANVDSQFYSALNTMEAELRANNLSTDIVGVTKSDYEKAKSSMRSQMMAKIL